ncbi:MAG TPA: sugar phosphate isomerase/epimerase [Acetobacteraceae bacterium]|jgi:2-keto-myo-inositol isomerase|nr:sugar phosphate isomerase/epimerase [Acetobacteraceae bacterium]
MKTCFNTVTVGLDKPLEPIIEQCGAVGYAGIEIDLRQLQPCLERISIAEIRRRLADARLEVASVMAFNLDPYAGPAPGLERLRLGARYAAELGAPILLTYCKEMVLEGETLDVCRARAVERVAMFADAAAPVAIALEPIGRTTVMGTPQAALDIAARVGRANVGIMMDTFHYHRSGVTLADVAKIPREKLLIVHVNDSEDRPREELRDAHRLHLGLGILPLVETLRLLHQMGYDGFLSVELFRQDYWNQDVAQVVRDSKAAFDATLALAAESMEQPA